MKIGSIFNKLTYVGPSDDIKYGTFDCACGTKCKKINYSSVKNGSSKSCGCLNTENLARRREEAELKELAKLRGTGLYAKWRMKVLDKDLYTCQKCGVTAVPLVAHHIEPFETAVSLRYDKDNGAVMCVNCHDTYHKVYKLSDVSRATYEEYITEGIK